MKSKGGLGNCENCGKQEFLTPLHGTQRGGPLFCLHCGMNWHGKHGRRRRLGRIVIRAIRAYFQDGGGYGDIDKLKLAAGGLHIHGMQRITLGYECEGDTIGAATPDITSELLRDTLQLTHPDHHPAERRELAQRVTQELIALKPFVWPAPKPEPPPKAQPRDTSVEVSRNDTKEPSRPEVSYPCEDCAGHVPFYYCNSCKAQWEKEQQRIGDGKRARRRRWYKRRKSKRFAGCCAVCGEHFAGKRQDAKHCSAACRQKAYRKRAGAE